MITKETLAAIPFFSDIPERELELIVPLCRLQERSEEHTSELQSRLHLVCRLLLEKKNKFLPAWVPVLGCMPKLMSFTISNQTCQSRRSVSIQCCICSCPCLSSPRSSSEIPLALAN